MHIALDKNGNRISAEDAIKSEDYYCPTCGEKVILKQGRINVTHFSHITRECSDTWNYDMSEWHYSMQERFEKEQREVVVKYKGQTHRADILQGDKVIEFQHSPISLEEIIERNEFYQSAGYKIAWVFDVQEQYDSSIISIMDKDNVLMYKWNNPKRYLHAFPQPKEYNKEMVVYFYWVDLYGYEQFNRVIWSSNEEGCPDFRRFIVADFDTILDDNSDKLEVDKFFITKGDMLKTRLSNLKCRYIIKRSGMRGYPQNDYICPKTSKFGLSRFGEEACSYCRYCAAIKEQPKGFESYCCYPHQVNQITNVHPGYECSGIPVF